MLACHAAENRSVALEGVAALTEVMASCGADADGDLAALAPGRRGPSVRAARTSRLEARRATAPVPWRFPGLVQPPDRTRLNVPALSVTASTGALQGRSDHVHPVHVIGHLATRADRDLPAGEFGRKIGPGKLRGESGNAEKRLLCRYSHRLPFVLGSRQGAGKHMVRRLTAGQDLRTGGQAHRACLA